MANTEAKKPAKSKLVPTKTTLKSGVEVVLDYATEQDYDTLRGLLNQAIEEGMTYPQLEPLNMDGFKAYFLPADAFAAKNAKGSTFFITIFLLQPTNIVLTSLSLDF